MPPILHQLSSWGLDFVRLFERKALQNLRTRDPCIFTIFQQHRSLKMLGMHGSRVLRKPKARKLAKIF